MQYQLGPFSHDGSQAVRVTARAGIDDSPRQDLTAALSAAGSGNTWTTRFALLSSGDASARCMLFVTDAAGTRQEILAESLVTGGAWSFVEGSRAISWQPPLTRAILVLRVDKVSETVFTDITVVDMSIVSTPASTLGTRSQSSNADVLRRLVTSSSPAPSI